VKFETILWDLNGTLLNDLHVAVSIINRMLKQRDLKQLSIEQYLEVFTFPVSDYYEQIGFDLVKEPFEIAAFQYISSYNKEVETCLLHKNTLLTLTRFNELGYRQFILSAMEQKQLEKIATKCGITHFFEGLYGLDNHFARSKVENGRNMLSENGLVPELTLLIGDTLHDYEVAQALGCSCILIAHGHQSRNRLLKTGTIVVKSLDQIEIAIKDL